MDEDGNSWWLLGLLGAAFVLGLMVLAVKDDYRFRPIIESNKHYYPSVSVSSP